MGVGGSNPLTSTEEVKDSRTMLLQNLKRESTRMRGRMRALFEKQKQPQWLCDGTIDALLYVQSDLRILCLLDDTQGLPPEITHVSDIKNRGLRKRSLLLERLSIWCAGIIDGFPSYNQIVGDEKRKDFSLASTALLCCRKDFPCAKEKNDSFDVELLQKQIAILNPHVLLACTQEKNDISLWKGILGVKKALSFRSSGYDIDLLRHKGVRGVDFYPPLRYDLAVIDYCLLEKVMKSYAFWSL